MDRILIFSDTHRNINKCIKIIDNIPCSMIFHLGDCVSDVLELKRIYPDIDFKYVAGNNDFLGTAPKELVVEFKHFKFYLTHGHFMNLNSILYKAEENNCAYAIYGHTHVSLRENHNGIILLNPGSISRPRDGSFSYGVIEIENGKYSDCIIKEEF